MAKSAVEHVCRGCGSRSARWFGRCPRCGEYGTVEEAAPAGVPSLPGRRGGSRSSPSVAPVRPARPVGEVVGQRTRRTGTGLGEFDRVLGGGLVPGQVVLLAGEPGVGKSTLLLEVAHAYAQAGQTVLYASGEESAEQIGVRADRIGAAGAATLLVADEPNLEVLLGHVEATSPDLLVVDSVQTIASGDVEGRPGGMAQVLEVTQALTALAKRTKVPLLLIGQSTRENAVAGPRALEHLVDTVLTFEGDRNTPVRLLRATKNRFGPADEVVCFEQRDDGLSEVTDPSRLFRAHRDAPVAGTCVTVTMEGRRALLGEVQSLVAPSSGPHPRRAVTGLDAARVTMLVAVTERGMRERLGDKLGDRDVYVATVAGARLTDPSADLAVCLAVASAAWDAPLPPDVLALGEVALSGDIRPVQALALRLAEAARLGFRRVLVPPGGRAILGHVPDGVTVVEVAHLGSALAALRNLAVRSAS